MAIGVVLGVGAGVAIGSRLNLGVSTSLQNLETKAKEGINDLSDAIKSKTSPNLADVKTSFPTKDIGGKNNPLQKAKAQPESKPKETRTQNLKKLETFSYFPTAMKYYIGFKIYDKVGDSVISKKIEKPIVDIYLPMPTNLVDSTDLTYDSVSLGPLGGAGVGAIEALQTASSGSDDLGQTLANFNSRFLKNPVALAKTAVDIAGATALRASQDSVLGSVLRQTLRAAPNPFLATVFSNVNLREHQFTYRFSPRSEDELFLLKEIIYNFRKAALPPTKGVGFSEGNYLLGFPYEVKIEFYPDKTVPFFFKPCVITSVVFNYAPDGSPAFFKTGDPVAVEFTINLRELEVITREDLDENVSKDFGRARSLGLVDASGKSTTAL